MECPAAREPAGGGEFGVVETGVEEAGDVGEVGVACYGLGVPPEHGVYCFGEFGGGGFVDAASRI